MGCNGSKATKDTKQPGAKNNEQSSSKNSSSRQGSPQKSSRKEIKELDAKALEGANPQTLHKFVKQGQLDVVNGIIKQYNLKANVMNAKIESTEDLVFSEDEQYKYSDLNLLHYAIANKQLDIVRYFLEDVKISLKNFGKNPTLHDLKSEENRVEAYGFPLKIAIKNKDAAMLEDLLTYDSAWQLQHIEKCLHYIQQFKAQELIPTLFKSFTMISIFRSLSVKEQIEHMKKWIEIATGISEEFLKSVQDELSSETFALIFIYVVLTNQKSDAAQIKSVIDKAHLSVTAFEYAHFKFAGVYKSELIDKAQSNQDKGSEQEKNSFKNLITHFEKLDSELESIKYLSGDGEYAAISTDLLSAISSGKLERVQNILESTQIKRLPLTPGCNHQSQIEAINSMPMLYWSPVLHMLHHKQASIDNMIQVFELLIKQGCFLRQSFRMSNGLDGDEQGMPRNPVLLSAVLILASDIRDGNKLIQYLLGEKFLNLWSGYFIKPFIESLVQRRRHDLLRDVLLPKENSAWNSIQNIFLSQSEEKRVEFIDNLLRSFSYSPEAIKALRMTLCELPYSRYLLLNLIDVVGYRKMNDYAAFEKCTQNLTQSDLQEMSKIKSNEEQFMAFMRYVTMLKEEDPKRVVGQKLIDKIQELENFKGYKGNNMSLQILEHESRVQQEEGVEEAAVQIHANVVDVHKRSAVKDIQFEQLFSFIQASMEQDAINFLRNYKLFDLMFIRGPSIQTNHSFSQAQSGEYIFQGEMRQVLNANLLQLAVFNKLTNLVKYILKEYKVPTASKQQKNIDPRIILHNPENEFDSTFTLRLALQNYDEYTFQILWNHDDLYTDQDLLIIVSFLAYQQHWGAISNLLSTSVAERIFQNASSEMKSLIRIAANNAGNILSSYPYNDQAEFNSDDQSYMVQLIREDDAQKIHETWQNNEVVLKQLIFNPLQLTSEEEPVFSNNQDDQPTTLKDLNPVQLAVHLKKNQALNYFVKTHGLRQAMGRVAIQVDFDNTKYDFNNYIFPLILKSKDSENLQFLSSRPGFIFSTQDFISFCKVAISIKWTPGLKTFLWSSGVQFFFTTLEHEKQREIVREIVLDIVKDVKANKPFISQIIEGTLAKKPYVKLLMLVLLAKEVPHQLPEFAKLGAECLKNLTAEDLVQLFIKDGAEMNKHELQYRNVAGSGIESDFAKIITRYVNEGKAEQNEKKQKKVRINEEAREYSDHREEMVEENRI